jgi:N-acetylneuraminate lyase
VFELSGILPALVSPFDKEGEINFPVLCDLIEWHLAAGLSGFYILGSTGEGLLMSEAERRAFAKAVVEQVRGRAPVVVHVGALTTRTACSLAAHAREIGADATSSIPPFYFNVGPQGVKQYYTQVAAASAGLPFYIYNIPGTTGVNITVDVVRELMATSPNLRGMKYTAYDMYGMRKIVELDEGRFNVLSGPDEMMIAAQAMGADGAIGTTENMIPRVFVEAYTAFRAGNVKLAEELQAKINWVVNAFLAFPGSGGVKEIMRLQGFDCGQPRQPLVALNDTQRGQLREMLEQVGFFSWGR